MATWNSNGSRADVVTQIGLASDGDTVTLPSGTFTDWTTNVIIDKAITLQGLGTITLDGNGRATACGTIITHNTASAQLIEWKLKSGLTSRMTGIQFNAGTSASPVVRVFGLDDARRFRMDHCVWNTTGSEAFYLYTVLGVMDRCTITTNPSVQFEIDCHAWGQTQGATDIETLNLGAFGNGSWADSEHYGTDKFFFIEDCNLTGAGGSSSATDGQHGGRVVFRHNTIFHVGLQWHGSEAELTRGGRCAEVYSNIMTGDGASGNVCYWRSGTALIHDNTITNWAGGGLFNLVNNSSVQNASIPYGGPDGHNPWHKYDAGNPFVTGSATSAGSLTMTDNTKTWTLNQWQGYTVTKTGGPSVISVSSMTRSGSTVSVTTSAPHGFSGSDLVSIWGADQYEYNQLLDGPHQGLVFDDTTHFHFTLQYTPATPATGTIKCTKGNRYSLINSNTTSGTIVWADGINGPTYAMFMSTGDTYEINKVTNVMDQCGMGAGSLVSYPPPSSPPAGWNDQVVSPCYEWANGGTVTYTNTFSGGGVYGSIREGTHYFTDHRSFSYTPFTYPHPLTGTSTGTGGRGKKIIRRRQ